MDGLQPLKVEFEEHQFHIETEIVEAYVEDPPITQSKQIENSQILKNSSYPNYQPQETQQQPYLQKVIKVKVIDYMRREKFEGMLTSNTVEVRTNRILDIEAVYANLVSELQKKQLITELFSIKQGDNEYQISIKVTFIIGVSKRSFEFFIKLQSLNLEIDEKLKLQQILLEKYIKNTIEALQNQQQQDIQQMEQNFKNTLSKIQLKNEIEEKVMLRIKQMEDNFNKSFSHHQSQLDNLKQSVEDSRIITTQPTINESNNIRNDVDNLSQQMNDLGKQMQQISDDNNKLRELLNQIQPNKQPDVNNSQVNPSLDNEIKEKLNKLKKKFKKFKQNQLENNTYKEQLQKLEQQVSELSKKNQEIKLPQENFIQPQNPGRIQTEVPSQKTDENQIQSYFKYNFQENHKDQDFYIGPVFKKDSEFSFMLSDDESNFYVGILINGDMNSINTAQACFIEIPTGKYRVGNQDEEVAKQFCLHPFQNKDIITIRINLNQNLLQFGVNGGFYPPFRINNKIKQAAFFFKTNEQQLDDLVDYSGQY